jgi:hypothetical protein
VAREITARLPDRSRPAEREIVRIKGPFERAEELSDDVVGGGLANDMATQTTLRETRIFTVPKAGHLHLAQHLL